MNVLKDVQIVSTSRDACIGTTIKFAAVSVSGWQACSAGTSASNTASKQTVDWFSSNVSLEKL